MTSGTHASDEQPGDERHRRMDAARAHARLSVQDLWLRYLALGGTGDAFDVDGYLQGLVPLGDDQQNVLAQALNEALTDLHHRFLIPMSSPAARDGRDDTRLRDTIADLLQSAQSPAQRDNERARTHDTPPDDRAGGHAG